MGPRHRGARAAGKSHVPYGRPGVHSSRRKRAAHRIASQLADERFPSPNRTRASRNLRSHSPRTALPSAEIAGALSDSSRERRYFRRTPPRGRWQVRAANQTRGARPAGARERGTRSDGDRSLDLTQLLAGTPTTIRLPSHTNPVRRYHVALTLQETTSEADRYYASDGGILELHSRTRLPRDGSSPFVRAE